MSDESEELKVLMQMKKQRESGDGGIGRLFTSQSIVQSQEESTGSNQPKFGSHTNSFRSEMT